MSVAERGGGIGSALLDTCKRALIERGVTPSTIGVVVGNDQAQALYERHSFQPHYLDLIAAVKA